MKLYNTLTRNVETVQPIRPPTVTIYTCGPTVYDYAHIGHWFTYIRWDLLVRTLKIGGLQPKWVMNITDVGHLVSDADEGEDKLEKGARREGKTAWEVAEFYTDDFLECMRLLNMLQPDELPRATAHIPEQIALIQQLEEKGYTYTIDDGVYYDTAKFTAYASFARLDLEEQQAGARVEFNPQKRNATDFALWKFSPKDQQRDMEWDSPWGKGFPGWHIECSAMSMKYLGETLDIHTGGIDHVPVHHTNEIAQSEAVTGKPFANVWLHSNHVMVNGEKISKSLGNGIRLQEIVAKGFSPMVVRLHVMESHYRSQSKFSWESLEAARNRLKRWEAFADLQFQAKEGIPDGGDFDTTIMLDQPQLFIRQQLQNDLDTPQAITWIDQLSDRIQAIPTATIKQQKFKKLLAFFDDAFGLQLASRKDINQSLKDLIAQRQAAREQQDWAASDELREQLKEQGIAVRDTDYGPIWYRL
jgi:cysteinyl-tRNA synthetase